MIVNVLMLKLTENTAANIAALQQKLLDMKGNIKELEDITVKANLKSGASSFDVVMIAKYASEQNFNQYIADPYHLGVAQYVQQVCAQVASVCYEE